MGCANSKSPEDEEFLETFVALAREEFGWGDYVRAKDGPRGTKIGARDGLEGARYHRGTAVYRAPMDIVAWFIRNQTEYNSLASTIDPEVLGTELAAMHKLDSIKIVKMKSTDKARLRWRMQFPSPLAPREFALVERTHQLSDGSLVVACRCDTSSASESPTQSLAQRLSPSRPASAKFQLSSLSAGSGEDDGPSRPQSRPISATLSALLRAASGTSGSSAVTTSSAFADPPIKGEAYFIGYLLEPVRDRKFTKVTFLSCLNPKLSESDYEALNMLDSLMAPQLAPTSPAPALRTASADSGPAVPTVVSSVRARSQTEDGDDEPLDAKTKLDMTLGSGRVLAQVESGRRYFEDPKTIWAEQLYRLASAKVGEFGFQPVEAAQYGEERLQTGTHVTNRGMGHGIIKMFDLMGRVHVHFDSGEERVFTPDEVSRELSAAVEVGTRVRHQTRGLGIIKRFDDQEGTIHVRFDTGDYHRYNASSWKEKFTVEDQGRAYANVNLSKCPQVEMEGITKGSNLNLHAGVTAPSIMRERATITGKGRKANANNGSIQAEALRISFVIAAPAVDILDYILDFAEDEKVGNLVEEHIVKEYSDRHRTLYQRVRYPQGLNDRDFVFDSFWQEVDDETYLIVQKSTETSAVPPVPNVVRANIVIRGYLLEPLYDTRNASGPDLMTRVTYLTCVEPGGLVPPKVVAMQNRTELLGALTDMRSFFWRREKGTALSLSERSAKRASGEVKAKLKRRSLRRRSVNNVLPAL